MRLLLILTFISFSLSAECILIMTKNRQMSSYFAEAFEKKGFKTKMIANIAPDLKLDDDRNALYIAEKSGCSYALFMPITMKSSNLSGDASLHGTLRVFRKRSGFFETISWSEKADEEIIDLQDKEAQNKIKKRFVDYTTTKAIEYFTRSDQGRSD